MSIKTVISVKVDKNVHKRARTVAKKIGIPLSMIVTSSLRKFAEEERVVFETENARRMSKKLELKLGKIDADIKAGRNLSPSFRTAADAIRWLNAK